MVITPILIDPVEEYVHGSGLSDLMIVPIQPQNLLTAVPHCLVLGVDRRPIVPKNIGDFTQCSFSTIEYLCPLGEKPNCPPAF